MGMVFYLIWAEAFRIKAICLWCTGVHVTTFLLMVVVLVAYALTPSTALDDLDEFDDLDDTDDEDADAGEDVAGDEPHPDVPTAEAGRQSPGTGS